MNAAQLQQSLNATLTHAGFNLEEIRDPTIYQGRPAWAIYYCGEDCKLQISWSARDGGIDYFLAPLSAPNELGLTNDSKQWHLMLMLSKAHDDLSTPGPDADDNTEIEWLKALFDVHINSARAALPGQPL
jgi:hypothetical protein